MYVLIQFDVVMQKKKKKMTSILFGIVRICRRRFECNDLENQKTFSHFFIPFLESASNFSLSDMLNFKGVS